MPSIHLTTVGAWFFAVPAFALGALFLCGAVMLLASPADDSTGVAGAAAIAGLFFSAAGLHLIGYPLFN